MLQSPSSTNRPLHPLPSPPQLMVTFVNFWTVEFDSIYELMAWLLSFFLFSLWISKHIMDRYLRDPTIQVAIDDALIVTLAAASRMLKLLLLVFGDLV